MDLLIAIFGFAIIFGIYLIPTWIASYRNHTSGGGIFVINLFLGWTFLGWVIALAWSVSGVHPPATKPEQ